MFHIEVTFSLTMTLKIGVGMHLERVLPCAICVINTYNNYY